MWPAQLITQDADPTRLLQLDNIVVYMLVLALEFYLNLNPCLSLTQPLFMNEL